MSHYAKGLCEKIKKEVNAEDYEHPLKGFKIVVDAGNGAGGFYADKVLSVLGADTPGSRYLEPDGMFPNHVPNPEAKEAMDSICEAVRESGADLGVIFDTDVDRGGAVDSKGNEINRNRLVAVAAAIALEGNDGGMIPKVTTFLLMVLNNLLKMTLAESITAIAEAIRMLSTRLLSSTLRA